MVAREPVSRVGVGNGHGGTRVRLRKEVLGSVGTKVLDRSTTESQATTRGLGSCEENTRYVRRHTPLPVPTVPREAWVHLLKLGSVQEWLLNPVYTKP